MNLSWPKNSLEWLTMHYGPPATSQLAVLEHSGRANEARKRVQL